MENIYHDYWDQELMYQFLTEDKCKGSGSGKYCIYCVSTLWY